MLQQLGYELTIQTPMAWVEIFRGRFTAAAAAGGPHPTAPTGSSLTLSLSWLI